MKHALTFLFGGLVASSWWAVGIWPQVINAITFCPMLILTISAVIFVGVNITHDEK